MAVLTVVFIFMRDAEDQAATVNITVQSAHLEEKHKVKILGSDSAFDGSVVAEISCTLTSALFRTMRLR